MGTQAAKGSGSLLLTVAANTTSTTRTATVTVNDVVIAIEQAADVQARQLTIGVPQISPGPQVPLFGKVEIAFDISGSPATHPQWPFDLSPPSGVPAGVGISVDAEFTDPRGNRFLQPAFYSQEYRDEIRDGRDWHLPTEVYRWRVRFSPNQVGRWQYRILAKDRNGVAESSPGAVVVVPSPGKGFIKVSTDDPRYFEFDDGSAFLGTGVQMREFLEDPVTKGDTELRALGANGISFVRMWISSIFGSAWTSWIGGRNQYRGYLPVTGLLPVTDPRTGDTVLAMRLDYEVAGDTGWFDACRFEFWDDPESIEPGSVYRIAVTYRGEGIVGPRRPDAPAYGLVAKMGDWNAACHEPGQGTPVTAYGRREDGWNTIEGTWSSGSRHFLPRLHLGLENVREGAVYVRAISVRKQLADGRLGPEILVRPSMEYEQYVAEEKAHAFDRVLEAAERYGLYLKLVILEKNDKIYLKMRDDGGWVTSGADNEDGFYGTGRQVNKARWLQQTWWRYLQARWGYSAHIHSWELTNEGDPNRTDHYELADEFGKFMHCRVFGVDPGAGDGAKCQIDHPNDHLVTTSMWSGFPAAQFWANARYPNVDYADLHAYISTSPAPRAEREQMQWDSAYYHLWHSQSLPRIPKPVVRGEAGMDSPEEQSESALDIRRDSSGVWLHNFIWSGLDPGGMYELYWWTSHVWSEGVDHRAAYRSYAAFVNDLPLNRGGYTPWDGDVTQAALRVVGQKNTKTGRLHLWIQNRQHTWRNVLERRPIPSVTGDILVPGFVPGSAFTVEWWDPYSDSRVVASEPVVADAKGGVRIHVASLQTDVAVKIRPTGEAHQVSGFGTGVPGGPTLRP